MLLLQWHHSKKRLWGFVFAERDWVGNRYLLIQGFGWEPFVWAFFQQKNAIWHLKTGFLFTNLAPPISNYKP